RRAWIEYLPEVTRSGNGSEDLEGLTRHVKAGAALAAALGASHKAEALTLAAAGFAVVAPFPVALEGQGRALSAPLLPRAVGTYRLVFEDETGLAGRKGFTFRLKPDPAPVVRLERPSPSKDLLTALPTAVLTLHVQAEDAVYGLRSVFLRYRTHR